MSLVFDGEISLNNNFDGEMSLNSNLDGEMGAWFIAGQDKHFAYEQSVASASWTIVHNLNKFPAVAVVDSAGTEVIGDVQYLDKNSLVITFAGAFSGTAYMN